MSPGLRVKPMMKVEPEKFNVAEDNKSAKPRQAKLAYMLVLPAWTQVHQEWISDGARNLYCTLWKLADRRTGRLFIPGRGLITLRQIEREAGITHNTRKKYCRELVALGGMSVHRDYVVREIGGRKLKILGPAQVTWLAIVPPASQKGFRFSQHKHSGSPTDQFKKQHKQALRPTDQMAERGHLQTNPPTVGDLVDQYSSKDTNSGVAPCVVEVGDPGSASDSASAGVPGSGASGSVDIPVQDGPVEKERGGQKAPQAKATAPSPVFTGPLATEKQNLAENLERMLRYAIREKLTDGDRAGSLQSYRKLFKVDALALGIDWKEYETLYSQTLARVEAELAQEKQQLLASLAESLFEGFWEHDDENHTCHAFGWFEDQAKELAIPPEEIEVLFHQTCEVAQDECDAQLAAAREKVAKVTVATITSRILQELSEGSRVLLNAN